MNPVKALGFAAVLCLAAQSGLAQGEPGATAPPAQESLEEIPTATVTIDGRPVLRLRGAGTYTAELRAAAVAARIVDVARDRSVDPAALHVVEADRESRIVAGSTNVLRLVDADAALEMVGRQTLADVHLMSIRQAVVAWREARTRERLLTGAGRSVAALLVTLLFAWVALRLGGALEGRLEARAAARAPAGPEGRLDLLAGHRLWRLGADVLRFVKRVSVALFFYILLGYVLVQFPWTRSAGEQLGEWLLNPLRQLGLAFVAWLPDFFFLVVLALLTRFLLRLVRQFFDAVGRGDLKLQGFDSEWAAPTYKLVRTAVIFFAVIMAYPYVPGSSTEAFKGISIFFGVLFSLGASSMIGNLIAGFAMTYRRAFRVGDVIRVEGAFGRVTATRLIVTHLRTPKNEEVVIPNSKILGAEVTNYTTLAESHGLILHTEVGIGYETPWRLVEAMLIEAARRVPDLLREPQPYVWQKSLGDFAITYEINAATNRPTEMPRLYTELHRAILDVFNENEIQIMTPAYEGDPEIPKIVAPAKNNPSLVPGATKSSE